MKKKRKRIIRTKVKTKKMKKTITTAIALILTLSINAQWETKNYVDEFGDDTEQTYKSLVSEGTFSNSATINSDLIGNFTWDEEQEMFYITLYEYGSKKATQIASRFVYVKIKDNDSKVHKLKAFFSKDGILLFTKKNYKKIKPFLETPGSYKLVCDYVSSYGSNSTYRLNFNID